MSDILDARPDWVSEALGSTNAVSAGNPDGVVDAGLTLADLEVNDMFIAANGGWERYDKVFRVLAVDVDSHGIKRVDWAPTVQPDNVYTECRVDMTPFSSWYVEKIGVFRKEGED